MYRYVGVYYIRVVWLAGARNVMRDLARKNLTVTQRESRLDLNRPVESLTDDLLPRAGKSTRAGGRLRELSEGMTAGQEGGQEADSSLHWIVRHFTG